MSECVNSLCHTVSPRCGEVWMCNITKSGGSVQCGYRPVFILSNDRNNTYSPTLNIIPITSNMNKHKLPVHVELQDYRNYGLKMPSTMLVEQIMTVPAASLDCRIGSIGDKGVLNTIRYAIGIQFPIMQT